MLLQNKKVAIIGGGPGGLTLARLLQTKGGEVKVYERDESREVRVQGATLDLHFESGLRALEEAGLMEAFKANYRPDNDRYRVMDEHAAIFHDDHVKVSTGDFGEEWFRPEIDRGPLRDILLDSLQPNTVVWDSHIVSLERSNNAWELLFKNGNKAVADLVIGADGAHSKIRPFVTPIQPFYSGVTFLVGNIPDSEKNTPKIHALLKGGKISVMGDSKTLFLSAKGDGSLDFYIGWKVSDNWAIESGIDLRSGKQVMEWFKKEYSHWAPIWLELFEHENTQFIPRPLYAMPLDQSWETQPHLTLLGDAAHLLPPNGEGVNAAMLDALELSKSLTEGKFTDLESALTHYERQMLVRFAADGKATEEMMKWMYSPNGLKIMVELLNPVM